MSKDLPPLDPELRRLLDVEADFPPEDAAMSARVWRGVERAIALPPGGGGDGGSGSPPPPASPGTLSKYVTVAALAFLAGGITGALVHRSLATPDDAPPPLPTPLAAVSAAPPVFPDAPPPPEPGPAASAAPPSSVAAQPSASSKAAPTKSGSDLARERAIIEVARTAVARGRTSAALAAIDRHAREFPRGQLVEEREGLRVIALGRAGRDADAREKAEAFRKKYPNSVLLPATQAAVEPKSKP